jgi:protein-disulfide isomerase-like protein with CxxC motif
MPVPKPSDAHDSEHVHGEVCKTVMAIRDTTIDNGIPILQALLQREYERGRRDEAAQILKTYREATGMAPGESDVFIHYLDQKLMDIEAALKAKGENHGE